MTKMTHPERRQFGRRESCLHGVCIIPGRDPVHCIVRNLSSAGALLELSQRITVPFNVRLRIDSKRMDVPCEVRHHGHHGIGVTFVDPATGATRRSATRADMPETDTSHSKPHRPMQSSRALRTELFGDQRSPPAPAPVRYIVSAPGRIIRGI